MPRSPGLLVVIAMLSAACAPGATSPTGPATPDANEQLRADMVTQQIEARGVTDPLVLEAMRATPRHVFVPADWQDQAYEDHPLPIGFGQTISQPYIVAWMSELLELQPGQKVLEIGTGSGYQAAVLSEMGMEVYTIEIVPELAERAREALESVGYAEVTGLRADGYFGWEEHAPFDGILVTAAPDHVPQPLVQQLRAGAHMIVPIGPVGAVQTLWKFTRDEAGDVAGESLGLVRFVPLTREESSEAGRASRRSHNTPLPRP